MEQDGTPSEPAQAWTLDFGIRYFKMARERAHSEGPESCQQDARRPSRRSSQSFLGYSYNAGSAGLVDGVGYPARSWGVV
jgi:hypothetical protein